MLPVNSNILFHKRLFLCHCLASEELHARFGAHTCAQLRHLVAKGFFFPPLTPTTSPSNVVALLHSISTDFAHHVCPEAGAANEGVLANFFNSLLSKKTGAPGSPGSGAVGAGVQGSAKKTGTTSFFRCSRSGLSVFKTLFHPHRLDFFFFMFAPKLNCTVL